jgi:hypothetical protein
MTPEVDRELQGWMSEWRDEPAPAAEARAAILKNVRRRSLTLAVVTAGEVVVTLLLLAMLGVLFMRAGDPETTAVVLAGSVLAVGALVVSLWNRKGTWRPAAETTEAFLGISILRCRRSLRAVRIAYGIMVVEAMMLVPWLLVCIRRYPDRRPFGFDPHLFYGALLAVIFGASTLGCRWYARRVRRERRALEAARRVVSQD